MYELHRNEIKLYIFFVFVTLELALYIYRGRGSMESAMLHQHVSIVANAGYSKHRLWAGPLAFFAFHRGGLDEEY